MRLLFITNFYPSASRGGYEQWCQEVADGLRSRGHDVVVLTSTHRRDSLHSSDPAWLRRELHLEMEFASFRNAFQFFTSRKRREYKNLTFLRETVASYKPDAILIWGMWNFPRSLPALAEKLMPGNVAYYIGDYWPTLPSQFENYWNAPARNLLTGLPKLILKLIAKQILAREPRPTLQLEHVLFPSAFMQAELRRKGVSAKNSAIVYGAIDTRPYLGQRNGGQNDVISLLYVGRITREKGVHTAVEAVGQLIHEDGLRNLKLTIVGDGDAEYVDRLHRLVDEKHLALYVTFQPAQPKETLPALYQRSDILLFTSIWAEPFGRVIVEAMASGVAVIGAATGGAAEIMTDNENALIFIPGNAKDLADKLMKLIESPELRERLGKAGRETALAKFDIQRMTTGIEEYLRTLTTK